MDKEIWREIPSLPGYEASNLGRVRSWIRLGRIVHHLILETFKGPRPPGLEGRHINDRDVTNNYIDNLEWGIRRDNEQDKRRYGTYQLGQRNPSAKLTDAQAQEIRCSKELLRVLAARYGVRESTISRIRNGVRRAG